MPQGYRQLEFRNVLVSPGRDFLGFSISLKEDKPGVLREIAEIVEGFGLNMNYIYGFSSGESRIIFVVDVTDRDVGEEDLVRELSSLSVVKEVSTFKPIVRGLIADTSSFPLTVFGERIIILRKSALKELIRGLMVSIGPQAASGILYQVGVRMGRGLAKKHMLLAEELGISNPREVLDKISRTFFQTLGYGIADVEMEDDRIIVRKRYCIECTSLKELMEENPTLTGGGCGMVRGIIEGTISEVMGVEYESKEVKCVARGDDHCVLVLKPRS